LLLLQATQVQIKPDEVVYWKSVRVPMLDDQVDHVRLWEKMIDYLGELDEMRALHV
jgi:hypothetical protein